MNGTRQYERFRVDMPVTVHPLDDEGQLGAAAVGRVRDIGEAGLSLWCESEYQVGSGIVLGVGLGEEPTWFLGQIRHAALAAEGGYVVGVSFLRMPQSGPIAEAIRRTRGEAA